MKTWEKVHDIGLGKDFWAMTVKDQATDTKAENLITSNQRRSKAKTQPTGWGDICSLGRFNGTTQPVEYLCCS